MLIYDEFMKFIVHSVIENFEVFVSEKECLYEVSSVHGHEFTEKAVCVDEIEAVSLYCLNNGIPVRRIAEASTCSIWKILKKDGSEIVPEVNIVPRDEDRGTGPWYNVRAILPFSRTAYGGGTSMLVAMLHLAAACSIHGVAVDRVLEPRQ